MTGWPTPIQIERVQLGTYLSNSSIYRLTYTSKMTAFPQQNKMPSHDAPNEELLRSINGVRYGESQGIIPNAIKRNLQTGRGSSVIANSRNQRFPSSYDRAVTLQTDAGVVRFSGANLLLDPKKFQYHQSE